MRKAIYLSVCIAAIASASCNKKTPDPTPTPTPTPASKAKVMYLNACTGTSTVYVKANDTALTNAASISYLSGTGYIDVTAAAAVKSAFYLTTSNLSLLDTTMALTKDAYYSIFLGGTLSPSKPAVLVAVADDLSTPSASKAKVRLVNLSTNNYSESIVLDTTTVQSGVNYKQVSPFIEIAAGNHTIAVLDPAHPTLQKQLTQDYASGKIYTFILTGEYVSATNNTLDLSIVANK